MQVIPSLQGSSATPGLKPKSRWVTGLVGGLRARSALCATYGPWRRHLWSAQIRTVCAARAWSARLADVLSLLDMPMIEYIVIDIWIRADRRMLPTHACLRANRRLSADLLAGRIRADPASFEEAGSEFCSLQSTLQLFGGVGPELDDAAPVVGALQAPKQACKRGLQRCALGRCHGRADDRDGYQTGAPTRPRWCPARVASRGPQAGNTALRPPSCSEPSSRVPGSHRKAGPARRAGSITCRYPALRCMAMVRPGN